MRAPGPLSTPTGAALHPPMETADFSPAYTETFSHKVQQ